MVITRFAADRHGSTVDVSALVASKAESWSGRVGGILAGVIPTDGEGNGADLHKEDDCSLHLGPEDLEEEAKVLRAKIQEAKYHGLSTTGFKNPETLLRKLGTAVKLKLDAG